MPNIPRRGSRRRRSLASLVAGSVTVALLAACGDDARSATAESNSTNASNAGHDEASPVAEDARHVAVTGRSLSFEPDQLSARSGEDIAIVFSSEDSLHDFTIDEFDAHVAAEAGGTSVGGFRAGEPGRYEFYCSVEGHREAGMEGVLVVEA